MTEPRQRRAALETASRERILVIDGAMGTMIQAEGFGEAEFRGARFAGHGTDLRGDNDLLNLTQPAAIEGIHRAYLEAGADILTTNTSTLPPSARPTTAPRISPTS